MSASAKPIAKLETVDAPAFNSLFVETLKNILRSQSAVAGIIIIGILLFTAAFAPIIATHDPELSMIGIESASAGLLPRRAPCIPLRPIEDIEAFTAEERTLFRCEALHILGLDLNARDQWSRIVYGARVSLFVGVSAVSFAIIVGTLMGLTSGYVGGWTDNIIMRFMDVLLAFPSLLLAITIVTIRGPGLGNALLAIAIVSIPQYARVVRASVLSVKEEEFVTAARTIGAPGPRIALAHVLPHALTPLIVQATLGIGTAVLDAAALSFLGLGAQPPTPEWGYMLSEARSYVFTSPHLVFFPGLAIMITVLGFNLLGDGMRDALDPRLNRN